MPASGATMGRRISSTGFRCLVNLGEEGAADDGREFCEDSLQYPPPPPGTGGWPPVSSELLWGRCTGENGRYAIDNIPFFATDINLGDVVEVTPENGQLLFSRVVRRSGHSTIRLLLNDPESATRVREQLESRGCESEQDTIPHLIAVDIPKYDLLDSVKDFVEAGQRSGNWVFEVGYLPGGGKGT